MSAAASLSDYDIEVTTLQRFSLAADDVDPQQDFIKPFSVRVLKYDAGTDDNVVVGEASGTMVLSTVACDEGYDLREVLDEYDGDLVEMYDQLMESGVEIPTWEDLLVLSDVSIARPHRVPGIELAVFSQLIRTAGAEMNIAVTSDACLGLRRKGPTKDSSRKALPDGMTRVARAGLIVWTGDRLDVRTLDN